MIARCPDLPVVPRFGVLDRVAWKGYVNGVTGTVVEVIPEHPQYKRLMYRVRWSPINVSLLYPDELVPAYDREPA